jgi:hypothetical protein
MTRYLARRAAAKVVQLRSIGCKSTSVSLDCFNRASKKYM